MKLTLVLLSILSISTYGASRIVDQYMADPEVRLGQKVYVITAETASDDRLIADLDGDTIWRKMGPLTSEEIFTTNYRNLTAGAHTLTVQLKTSANVFIDSIVTEWTTLHNGIPTVGFDENNSMCIEGQLHFPTWALWNYDDAKVWLDSTWMTAVGDMRWLSGKAKPYDYTAHEYGEWLDTISATGGRIVGPSVNWAGYPDDPLNTSGWHGKGNDTNDMKHYLDTLHDNDGILGWMWGDEHDGGGDWAAPPSEVRTWQELLKRYDTNHPHIANFVAYGWGWDASEYYFLKDSLYSYLYSNNFLDRKKPMCDMIGFDYYPIEYATDEHYPDNYVIDPSHKISFRRMCDAIDKFSSFQKVIPTFYWLENCDLHTEYTASAAYPDFNCSSSGCTPGVDCPASERGSCRQSSPYTWTPPPTADQMWNEAWLKIIHGAKGLKIHSHFDPECDTCNGGALRKLNNYCDTLAHLFLGSDCSFSVTVDSATYPHRVDVMSREVGDTIFVAAARLTEVGDDALPAFNASIDLSAIATGTATVVSESRTVTITDSKLTDSYAPWDVHLYKIVKVQQVQPISVYFIGNSLTVGLTPDRVFTIAMDKGDTINFGCQLSGAKSLIRHLNYKDEPAETWISWETNVPNGDTWTPDPNPYSGTEIVRFGLHDTALVNFSWDYLVLQPYVGSLHDDTLAAAAFINMALQQNPNVQVLIYSTWPRRSGDVNIDYAAKWDGLSSDVFTKAYFDLLITTLNNKFDWINNPIRLVPVGDIVDSVNTLIMSGNLSDMEALAIRVSAMVPGYTSGEFLTEGANVLFYDDVHFNPPSHLTGTVGTFIMGTAMTAVITGRNPVGLSANEYGLDEGLDAALISTLQNIISNKIDYVENETPQIRVRYRRMLCH